MESVDIDKMPHGLEFSVFDHFSRARFFLEAANNFRNDDRWSEYGWCIASAIYSCRAIKEIVDTYVNDSNNNVSQWHSFENNYQKIRHSSLIASFRVHDFHRNAIYLGPGFDAFYGPAIVTASKQKGSAAEFKVENGNIVTKKLRNASIKLDRPISVSSSKILNDENLLQFAHDIVNEHLVDLIAILQPLAKEFPWYVNNE